MYLLFAVELTSLARTRLPRRLWRRVHYASFVVFAATTVHGLSAGTDAPALLLAYLAVPALMAGLTASRFLASTRRAAGTRTPSRRPPPIPGLVVEVAQGEEVRSSGRGSP